MKDINNFNSKIERHGYQEFYYNNKLYYRGTWKNGLEFGYIEINHKITGGIGEKDTVFEFYIK